MTGMDRWIAWDKGDFLGRKAALAESKGPPPERQLVTLEIDARRCGRDRLRAGLAIGRDGRLRDLRRLWPHGGKEPGDGAGRAGSRRDRLRAQRAYCRRRAQSARHRALALRSRGQGDAGMTGQRRLQADDGEFRNLALSCRLAAAPAGAIEQRQGDPRRLARHCAHACSPSRASTTSRCSP